ncbi:MAG: hypothetical protein LBU68_00395 [Rickettsiales bacterium]|jgi:hypothetical protein|nr:hypothetical protein [Rickettsiales bacterium]
MNINKCFKIILSVGIGLILGALLLYKLNELNGNSMLAGKGSESNINEKYARDVVVSDRVINSSNNRYGKLSNYPATREDVYVVNSSVAKVRKLAKQNTPEFFNQMRTVGELESRGYLAVNEMQKIGEYKARGLRNYRVFSPTAMKKHDAYTFTVEQKKRQSPNWQTINSDVILTEENISSLQAKTVINGNLYVQNFDFVKLPKNIRIRGNLYIVNSRGVLINENTTIDGNVFVRGVSSLKHIVESVKIGGQVFVKRV